MLWLKLSLLVTVLVSKRLVWTILSLGFKQQIYYIFSSLHVKCIEIFHQHLKKSFVLFKRAVVLAICFILGVFF